MSRVLDHRGIEIKVGDYVTILGESSGVHDHGEVIGMFVNANERDMNKDNYGTISLLVELDTVAITGGGFFIRKIAVPPTDVEVNLT